MASSGSSEQVRRETAQKYAGSDNGVTALSRQDIAPDVADPTSETFQTARNCTLSYFFLNSEKSGMFNTINEFTSTLIRLLMLL